MNASVAAVPMLPGAAEAMHKLAADVAGPRRNDHDLSRSSLGITRERWYTNEDEGLGFLILEGPGHRDAAKVFAAPHTEHQAWYMTKLAPATSASLDWMAAFSGEQIYSSEENEATMLQSSVMAFPLMPGSGDSWRTLAVQATSANKDSFDDFHARLGLRETWWVLREPEGEIALMYFESDDIVGAISDFADSQQIADLWLRQKYLEIQGIDWRGGIPQRLSKLTFEWSEAREIALDAGASTPRRRPERAR